MKLEHRIVGFEMRAASDDGSEFSGYASCFYNIDSYGSIIARGAFTDSLPEFLESGFIGGLNHDWDKPIGKPVEATEDLKGLFTKGVISDTSHGRDVKVLLKDGVIKKLSIGFTTQGYEWLDTAEAVEAYWKSVGYTPTDDDIANSKYGASLRTKIKLYEYSPVTVPGNSMCDITEVRQDVQAGPLAGLRLDDHLVRVLATNEELLTRIEGLAAKRAEDGRTLSDPRRAQLRRLRDGLESLLSQSEPRPTAEELATAEAEQSRLENERARRQRLAAFAQLEADLLHV